MVGGDTRTNSFDNSTLSGNLSEYSVKDSRRTTMGLRVPRSYTVSMVLYLFSSTRGHKKGSDLNLKERLSEYYREWTYKIKNIFECLH